MFSAKARQRIKLRPPVVLAGIPFRGDPALLLQFVQRRIQRSIADLENVSGNLFQSLADGHPFKGSSARILSSSKSNVPCTKSDGLLRWSSLGYRYKDTATPVGNQEKAFPKKRSQVLV